MATWAKSDPGTEPERQAPTPVTPLDVEIKRIRAGWSLWDARAGSRPRRAVEPVAGGKIITAPPESVHVPFAQYGDAYRYIDEHGDRCVKVFIDVN